MKWKNIASDTSTFFITATITQWQLLLANDEVRDILLRGFEFYRAKYRAKILAYVIMPEHYHIVIELERPDDLHGWLRDLQSHTASAIAKWLKSFADPQMLNTYAKHANSDSTLAIWKEQARALGITSLRTLHTKIDYIHKNSVSRELVLEPGDWLWSSWRNYYSDDDSVFRIDRIEML